MTAESEEYRLDIVLRCEEAKFILVIENKIDADESEDQLEHYDEWLQKQWQFNFRNLAFLTRDGREPSSIPVDKCLCLSYREHVTGWLRNLEIEPAHLRFAIDQYAQVIDAL